MLFLFRPINRVVSLSKIYRPPVSSNKPVLVFNSIRIVRSYSTSIPPPEGRLRRALLSVVKFGSVVTLSTTAFLAYLSYAYTVEELFHKTDYFRQFALVHPHPLFAKAYRGGSDFVPGGQWDSSSGGSFQYPVLDYGSDSPPVSDMAAVGLAIDAYLLVRYKLEQYVKENYSPLPDKLLPNMDPVKDKSGVCTLVLDLNETLVHSDWKDTTHDKRHSINLISGKYSWEYEEGLTFKRPGLDAFLERVLQMGYEVVLYTDASCRDVDKLALWFKDGFRLPHRLTKEHTKCQDGKRYRDLSRLNRDPSRIVYVSGHALENCLQPENCVPIKPWKKQVDDTTLGDLLPFLEYIAFKRPYDIRPVLSSYKGKDIATEFIEHSKYQPRKILGILGWWRKHTQR